MSPEQTEMNAVDVDTRSDLYSLGVVLYELLTGRTPLDPRCLRKAGYDEVQRLIREEEPVRPSTRISSLGDALPKVAKLRGTEPVKLTRQIRGDLDWIVKEAGEYVFVILREGALGPVVVRQTLEPKCVELSPRVVGEEHLRGWSWKVRAKARGVWQAWSPPEVFVVAQCEL